MMREATCDEFGRADVGAAYQGVEIGGGGERKGEKGTRGRDGA